MTGEASQWRVLLTALVGRNLRERWRFLAAICLATTAVSVMVALLYPSVGGAYDEVFDDLPEAVRALIGDGDFSTPSGFLHVELFSFLGPGLAIGAGVGMAASALAGLEQNGQLALIVASPVRRSSVVGAAVVSTLLAVTMVASTLFLSVAGGSAIAGLGIPLGDIAAAASMAGLLAAAVGALALGAGALSGCRSLATGVGAGAAVLSYVVDAFFPLASGLAPFAKVSIWYPYAQSQPILNGFHLWHSAVLVVVWVVACAVALVGFERRDLNLGG
jgi:ABC-2 type transport system permease protein